MLNLDRIAKAKLDIVRISGEIDSLFSGDAKSFLADPKSPLALKYLLIEAVEAIADICQHLLAKIKGIPCEGYVDCILKAGKEGIISVSLSKRLRRLADLRNIIVHRYWVIEDRQVYSQTMENKGDLLAFVNEVDSYLSSIRK